MNDQEILAYLKERCVGFALVCGIEYEAAGVGHCTVALNMEQRFLNPQGAAHGGLLATLMDVAAGSIGLFACGSLRPMVTQSADIHYFRPITGPRVVAEGRCLKAGRRCAVVQVDVRENDDDRVCATGVFELCYLDIG